MVDQQNADSMWEVYCPSCGTEAGESTNRTILDEGGLEVEYMCSNCGHEWDTVF